MKRGHEPHSNGSQSKQSRTKNSKTTGKRVFSLLNLPEDEFKLILTYLPIRDRANLKVTSKDAEKRLMLLDPSLRRWKIYFSKYDIDDDFDRLMSDFLTQARHKHIKDGDLEDIEIHFIFEYRHERNILPHDFIDFSENLIKKWRNNIVSLKIGITGQESYFLDPKFVLPQLSCLSLDEGICPEGDNYNSDDYKSDDSVSVAGSEYEPRDPLQTREERERRVEKTKMIATYLIHNHKDTLETLHLKKIEISFPLGLQLKQFKAVNVDPKTVCSVLNGSYSSLQQLDLQSITELSEQEFVLPSTLPQLRELNVSDVIPADAGQIIKSSYQTLQKLVIKEPREVIDTLFDDIFIPHIGYMPLPRKVKNLTKGLYGLDSIELKIKTFKAVSIPPNDLVTIVKASQKSLEELDIDNSGKQYEETSHQLQQIKLLKLNKFCAKMMTATEICLLLDASSTSLKVLDLNGFQIYENETENNFDLNCTEFHIKKLSARHITQQMIATILAIPNDSLVDLSLCIGYNSQIEDELEFQCSSFPIKKFIASEIYSNIISKIIKSSKSTLQDISIQSPIACDRFQLDDVHLKQLKSLSLTDSMPLPLSSGKILKSMLRASHTTLEVLEVGGEQLVGPDFKIEQEKIKLKKFDAQEVSTLFVESVLRASQSTLQQLKVTNLVNSRSDNFQLDSTIHLGQVNNFSARKTDSKFVISIIRSAKTSLKYLQLQKMKFDDPTLAFNKDDLKLIRFSSMLLDAKFVATVIQGSISSLEHIILMETQTSPNDYKDNIELIEILLGSRNQNSIDDLNDEEGKKSADQKITNIQALEKGEAKFTGGNTCYHLQVKGMFYLIRQLLMTQTVQYNYRSKWNYWETNS